MRMRLGLLGLTCLTLAGCGSVGEGRLAKSDRSELLGLLAVGRPVLDCREACLEAWKNIQPTAMQLAARGQWSDLAVSVMRSGYQDDLSLYYLGRAAEGMGFDKAAASYYRQSMELSGTSISCVNLSRLCGGVTLPRSAAERLAAVQRVPVPRVPRPSRAPANPPPLPTAPAASEAPTPAAMPEAPTPPTPADANPAGAVEHDVGPSGAGEYIEPPPARR